MYDDKTLLKYRIRDIICSALDEQDILFGVDENCDITIDEFTEGMVTISISIEN